MYLGLTGTRVKSRDLVKWGIATHYVPKDNIDSLYTDLTSNVQHSSSNDDILKIVNSHAVAEAHHDKIDNIDEINHIF